MNKLRAIRLFVRLAETKSFSVVADEIDATTSMVSKEISRLEDDLGVRLVQRTTRNIQLTTIGEGYLKRCRELLIQYEDSQAYIQQMQDSPKGKLRVNLPMALGLTDLSQVIADFMVKFPDVELDVHLGDESVDLIEHGFDLGFRASSTSFDSSYIGKALTRFTYHICGSQKYFETHPPIQTAMDLEAHNCFVYSYFRAGSHWPVDGGVTINGNLKVNSTIFMRKIIEQGLGIGFLPCFVADKGLKNGSLVEVLKNAQKPRLTLYALYPNRKFVSPILMNCIQFIQDWFQSSRRSDVLYDPTKNRLLS